MRISTKMLHQSSINALLDRQKDINKTQGQLATGRRILTPSDDPSGATRILGLKNSIQTKEQYQDNIGAARQYIGLEEQSLVAVGNALQRIRELAIQGNNDSQTADTRRTIAAEVRQHLDAIMNAANIRNSNGEYLFSGYKGNTQPFSRDTNGSYLYQGDQGQRFLQISENRKIATSDSGAEVFMALPNGNGTFVASDTATNTGTGTIDPGSVVDPTLIDGDRYRISFGHSAATNGTMAFSDVIGTDDTLSYTLDINGTTVYSVDETGTPLATVNDLASQINLSTGATNVRAVVSSGNLYLVNTSAGAGDIVISETLAGFTPGDGDSLTGYFGSNLNETSTGNSITLAQSSADFYMVEDSAGNLETSGVYQEDGSIIFNGYQTSFKGQPANGDVFTITPSSNQSIFQTVQNLVNALESGANDAAGLTQFHNSVNRFLTDIDQASDKITNTRATLGTRFNAVDSQENVNEDLILELKSTVSVIEDLDYTQAISALNLQMAGLQAAQQVYVRMQNLSLFNYL